MSTDNSQPDLRNQIDVLIDSGEQASARVLAGRYWRANPNASAARFLKARLNRIWPAGQIIEHRVAIVRSFTVEPVLPLLQAEAALAGCRLVPWIGNFNTYGQEILDPTSDLYAHAPQTIILAVQARDVVPALWSEFSALGDEEIRSEIDTAAASLGQLVRQLRANTSANIVVQGLETPLRAASGYLDARRPMGQKESIEAVNSSLRAAFAEMSNVYLLDYADLQARHGRMHFFSEKKWVTARLPLSVEGLAWLAEEWWRYLSQFAMPRAKVLALDLDNTLWGGVIGEDGLTGINLSEEHPGVYFKNLQRAVLDISRRGIVIALVSKNNLADAMLVIDEHPEMLLRRENIAAMRINWEPKAANLTAIAEELNVGLDAFVFLDDNPAEREAVRRSLPQVIVPELSTDPSTYADLLRSLPELERLDQSTEDSSRTRYYTDERERKSLMGASESLDDFLTSLDIHIGISPIDAMSLARAAQLTQKTNQLNMTTRRFNETELTDLLAQPGWSGWVLRAADRFGDNGIVGVAMTHTTGTICEIDTFLLSCRVIGRRIETAFLAFLADTAMSAGVVELRGWILPTAKNLPARQIYQQSGMVRWEIKGDNELWGIKFSEASIVSPGWITLDKPLRSESC